MAASTQPDLTTLQADIQQLRADFAKMTADLREAAGSGIGKAQGMAQDSAERMWGEVSRQAQQVGQEIEARPFASALVAFTAGLVFGLILNGRRG
jgi:ElaB/YqjD/DUF883 family membrane-anchored ribosome-binding protein